MIYQKEGKINTFFKNFFSKHFGNIHRFRSKTPLVTSRTCLPFRFFSCFSFICLQFGHKLGLHRINCGVIMRFRNYMLYRTAKRHNMLKGGRGMSEDIRSDAVVEPTEKEKFCEMSTRNKVIAIIKSFVADIYVYAIVAAVAFILSGLVLAFGIIPSASMEPTYKENSFFVGSRIVDEEALERGTPLLFYYEEDVVYLKRVIGLPGETISIYLGDVYVDGQKLDESTYLPTETYTHPDFHSNVTEFVVPEGSYFVLGDNRGNSYDSRFWEDPYVDSEDVVGKLLWAITLPWEN